MKNLKLLRCYSDSLQSPRTSKFIHLFIARCTVSHTCLSLAYLAAISRPQLMSRFLRNWPTFSASPLRQCIFSMYRGLALERYSESLHFDEYRPLMYPMDLSTWTTELVDVFEAMTTPSLQYTSA